MKRFGCDVGVTCRSGAEHDGLHGGVIRDGDTHDVVEVVLEVDVGGDEFDIGHRLNALDAVEGDIGDLPGLVVASEAEPAVVVLAQVIRVNDKVHVAPAVLVGVVVNLHHPMFGGSIDECAEVLQSLEQGVLLEAHDALVFIVEVEAELEVGDHLLNPLILGQATEARQRHHSLLQLLCLGLAQGLLVDAETRVGITVIHLLALALLLKFCRIAALALHELDVVEDLATAHSALEVVVQQGFVAGFD